jgi:FAD:protein FMN transferase
MVPDASARDAGSPGAIRRLRPLMGTLVAIEADSEQCDPQAAIERAFAEMAELETRLHPSRPGSDLARINAAGAHRTVAVGPHTHRLLAFARELHVLTQGVFDPCRPSVRGRLQDLRMRTTSGDPQSIQVVCEAPVQLDFGGFAKGYAVDRAIEILRAAGCHSALVNAGGDLRSFGKGAQRFWIRHRDGRLVPIGIGDGALAVSALSASRAPAEHCGYYDRSTEHEARRLRPTMAAVLAADAMTADALTKCVLLCAPPIARRALLRLGARAVLPDRYSSGIREYRRVSRANT